MPIEPGARLGSYEVLAKLGAGGMGEVYRARDTRLDRDVALKVLPPAFTGDPDRLMRFAREAKTLAALNHPNIAAIYGLEDSPSTSSGQAGAPALVMEHVEGEDLAARLARGALPMDEALAIARQIAEALEAAHEQGIIHRDLKPANIKVRADGTVKVLDFGLAKALEPAAASSPEAMNSPTITSPAHLRQGYGGQAMTQAGVILGTAAYMAPEQARGKAVDRRADIWAFGCVLYEMLTSRRPFPGADVTDTIVAVMSKEPDWSVLPSEVPAAVRQLLRRCLDKDRTRRLDSAVAARLDLEEARARPRPGHTDAGVASPPAPASERSRWALALAGVALALASAAGGGLVARRTTDRPMPRVTRFDLPLPSGTAVANRVMAALALSPDDRAVVFAAGDTAGSRLYLRRLDRVDAQPLAGTEDASEPFFSPDGRWVGFRAGGQLKKVSIDDGTVVAITAISDTTGASWAPDGTIVFASIDGGLSRVSANGGPSQPFVAPSAADGESSFGWPDVLPDGEHVLFTIEHTGRPFDEASIGVVSLRTGARHVVHRGGTSAKYAPSGHLLYVNEGRLLSVPFDVGRLAVTGEPATVLEGVAAEVGRGRAHFAVSRTGSLTYAPGPVERYEGTASWMDRTGAASPASNITAYMQSLSLAPDGQRLLFERYGADNELWLVDLARGGPTRLTFGGENAEPAWAPDGRRFAWSSTRDGPYNLYVSSTDDPSKATRVAPSEFGQLEPGWSPDGRQLVYVHWDATRNTGDLWTTSLDGSGAPHAVVQSPFDEQRPAVSPDGRWLAFASNETGRYDVYVQPFPGPGPKRLVSDDTGDPQRRPRWSADGRELFYFLGSTLMSVSVASSPGLEVGVPRSAIALVPKPDVVINSAGTAFDVKGRIAYDVAPDGRRFLVARFVPPAPLTRLIVALGGASASGIASANQR